MSAEEQKVRTELVRLLSRYAFVRGTLNVREKVCGKPTCRCTRGQPHTSLYLVASDHGRPRQLYIPRTLHQRTEQWVETHRRIRELLEELSKLHWDKLQRRE